MNKMLGKIKSLMENIFTLFLPILLSLVPKDKNLWLFSAWSGKKYADNPKAFFEYVSANKTINAIWITKCKSQAISLRESHINAIYHLSIEGILHQIRASVVFLSHNIGADFTRPLICKNTIRVNLWHGMPLKKIRFSDEITYLKLNISIKSSVLYKCISNESYDFITSLGHESTKILSAALGHSSDKFLDVGFPRNDVLMSSGKGPFSGQKLIIYMPTFRGAVGSTYNLLDEINFVLDDVEDILVESNANLILKFHPANKPTKKDLDLILNSTRVSFSDEDAHELLKNSDALITDYSSIMFDFALTKKPLIFLPYDRDNYFANQRASLFDYDKIISTQWSNSITGSLKLALNQLEGDDILVNHYLLSLHKHVSGSASSRLFKALSEKL